MKGPGKKSPVERAPIQGTPTELSVAFTWSPAPNLQRDDPLEGYKNQLPVLRHLVKCCSQIELHPEFHLNGSLHYHATLLISDTIKWYRMVLPTIKKNGFVCIKKNPDMHWSDYIQKDWALSKAVLELDKPIDISYLKRSNKKHAIPPPSFDGSLLKYVTITEVPREITIPSSSVFNTVVTEVKDDYMSSDEESEITSIATADIRVITDRLNQH